MKKIISLILSLIIIMTSFHLFAFAAIIGDVDDSGAISAVDARLILQYVAGLKSESELSNPNGADVNRDGKITAVDARKVLQIVAGLIEEPTEPEHVHDFSDATCVSPATCSCGETDGEALGHSWIDATCTSAEVCSRCGELGDEASGHSWTDATCASPKTCMICGATEGIAAPHNYVEISRTDGDNVGSVITYQCDLCYEEKIEEIKPLTLNVYRSGAASINGWLSQVNYTANASGGCGGYEYKFEVYLTETSSSPALVEDFSSNNTFGWTSRFYCNGNMLIVTVRDRAGNEASEKIIVD